ncbi:MAG TPA: M24 family metallopeptidase [Trueperaceae bacterium]
MDWIATAQAELQRQNLSGWLIYDFRGLNPFAGRFVQLGGALLTRRWFCFVPAHGRPVLLVHAIERGSLPEVPFEVRSYDSRQSLAAELRRMLPQAEVALETSPMNDIPYVSYVDAGTIEFLRSLGVRPVSSANLLQAFSAWTPRQLEQHLEAVKHVEQARELAFAFLQERSGKLEVRETEVQKVIRDTLDAAGLVYDHAAIVGFGPHAGDPHYAPRAGSDRALQPGDAVLVDLWAKLPDEGAPYADITWMGVAGEPSEELQEVFEIVRDARDLAVETMRRALGEKRVPQGREIDRAVRDFITARGYGAAFSHRTGHSLGTRYTHGDAAHLDDFETCDTRELIPGVALTVEPGIYLPHLGVRSEIDLIVEEAGPRVTTERQQHLVVIGGR